MSDPRSNNIELVLRNVLDPVTTGLQDQRSKCAVFERNVRDIAGANVISETYPDVAGVSSYFVRVPAGESRTVRFLPGGFYSLRACALGGWIASPSASDLPSYWIPQGPVLRSFDARERILSEKPAMAVAIDAASGAPAIDFAIPAGAALDFALWRFEPEATDHHRALEVATPLELAPLFLWGSQSVIRGVADAYRCLIHGRVYENRFDWQRKRKICSELEAYALYVALLGLERSTGKRVYELLRRQLLASVIERQSEDGGWYHGEWTDYMESHFRYHNGGLLLLEAAFEEWPDELIRSALGRAASFIARKVDRTDIGVWYLHDTLEESAEMMDKAGARWVPSRLFGKAPATKLILNTHLDAIVGLDRYRTVTGDDRYAADVASARKAVRALLDMRPAERLYRLLYRIVGLTLLPAADARRLPLPLRALRRLAKDQLLPRLYLVKRRYPRMVMPGGFIERHLSRLHFGVNYHTYNLMDLARLRRRYPDEPYAEIIDAAAGTASDAKLLQYWVEARQWQSLGFWVEAAYQLCTLDGKRIYRRYLAEAMLVAEAAGIGLSPSLMGANPEAIALSEQTGCPSPADHRLRIANLGQRGRAELLVVNAGDQSVELRWDDGCVPPLVWRTAGGEPATGAEGRPLVPAKSWILGRVRDQAG